MHNKARRNRLSVQSQVTSLLINFIMIILKQNLICLVPDRVKSLKSYFYGLYFIKKLDFLTRMKVFKKSNSLLALKNI